MLCFRGLLKIHLMTTIEGPTFFYTAVECFTGATQLISHIQLYNNPSDYHPGDQEVGVTFILGETIKSSVRNFNIWHKFPF